MITLTRPSPGTSRVAIAVSLGAGAIGAIDTLDASGMHIIGQDADELKLGYLLCALSQQNQIPPADAAAYMTAARTSELCATTFRPLAGLLELKYSKEPTRGSSSSRMRPASTDGTTSIRTRTAKPIPTTIRTMTLAPTEPATV